MKIRIVVFLLLLGASASPSRSAGAIWSIGYYTPWNNTANATSSNLSTLQWSALTHMIVVAAGPNTNGTLNYFNAGNFASTIASTISTAHTHNVKVLLDITSANGSFTNAFGAQNSLATLITNIMSVVNSDSFDGVDIDFEEGWNQTLMNNLLSGLRTSLGSKLLTAFANDSQFNWSGPPTPVCAAAGNGWTSTQIGYLDRLNLGAYDLGNPGNGDPYTWFNYALHSDTNQFLWSADYLKTAAINCGVSAAKLTIGLPFYGTLYTVNTAPRQTVGGGSTATQEPYSYILTNFSFSSPTYDITAHAPWKVQSGTRYLAWANTQAIDDAINYIKAQSLGGIFVYALGWDGSDCSVSCPLLSQIGLDLAAPVNPGNGGAIIQ
jgi:GH18 family chitinase